MFDIYIHNILISFSFFPSFFLSSSKFDMECTWDESRVNMNPAINVCFPKFLNFNYIFFLVEINRRVREIFH